MAASESSQVQIPVIDISGNGQKVGNELLDAVTKWGFVFIHGEALGFDKEIIDDTFDLASQFFRSPLEEKNACHISPDNKGFSSMRSEILDQEHQKRGDCKEYHVDLPNPLAWKLTRAEPSILANSWMAELHSPCQKRSKSIHDEDGGKEWFTSRHDPSKGQSGTILRLLHYPALAAGAFDYDAGIDIRAGAHSDYGSLTLLFQRVSQPGLEILTRGSSWAPVPVYPPGTDSDPFPPILVNVGDLLSYWTNGLLKSTVHRVVFPNGAGEDRFSIAYFCHPVDDAPLVPIPSDLVTSPETKCVGSSGEGENMTAAEHLKSRLAATYGWRTQEDPSRD